MKSISPTLHGYLDYVAVALFLIAPTVVGFTGTAEALAYMFARNHLIMTVATEFPLGAVSIVPFGVHRLVERLLGAALTLLPLALGFDVRALVFFTAMGFVIIVVELQTELPTKSIT